LYRHFISKLQALYQRKFQEFEWIFVMNIIFYFHSRCDW